MLPVCGEEHRRARELIVSDPAAPSSPPYEEEHIQENRRPRLTWRWSFRPTPTRRPGYRLSSTMNQAGRKESREETFDLDRSERPIPTLQG